MEKETEDIAIETKTEDFDFQEHFLQAFLGALYYLIVFIPTILPFKIWSKAAVRISTVWDDRSIDYNENEKSYPIFSFYLNYLLNFLYDAMIFLVWPVGLIYSTYSLIDGFEYMDFFGGYVLMLFYFYISVIVIRIAKETTFFILNYLVTWILDVIKNIGRFIKNVWLLNFVYKQKGN